MNCYKVKINDNYVGDIIDENYSGENLFRLIPLNDSIIIPAEGNVEVALRRTGEPTKVAYTLKGTITNHGQDLLRFLNVDGVLRYAIILEIEENK